MHEKIPVLIAAHNEEAYISRTLAMLDSDKVEPIVLANGCSDRTVDVARETGASVIEIEEQGKLPAIQCGLKKLGARALQPLLMLDADSYPLTSKWSDAMLRNIEPGRPSVVAGITGFFDGNRVEDALRTSRRKKEMLNAQSSDSLEAVSGANMGLYTYSPEVLEEIVEMPHVWPGEDRAIANIIKVQGELHYESSRDARVMVSSRFYPSVVSRILGGSEAAIESRVQHYRERAAASVSHEFDGEKLITLQK